MVWLVCPLCSVKHNTMVCVPTLSWEFHIDFLMICFFPGCFVDVGFLSWFPLKKSEDVLP